MSHYKYSYMILLLCLSLLAVVVTPILSEDSAIKDDGTRQDSQNIVDKLQAMTVTQSTELKYQKPTERVMKVMRAAAETKRVDALVLLIKGLAYHSDLYNSNEPISDIDVFPVVRLLQAHYGSLALPYLYLEGITTDKPWMRKRCAYAIRLIATKDEIARYKSMFSFQESTSEEKKGLPAMIAAETIDAASPEEVYKLPHSTPQK